MFYDGLAYVYSLKSVQTIASRYYICYFLFINILTASGIDLLTFHFNTSARICYSRC